MFRIWKYMLFFLLCLVVALLFNLPISHVLPYVKLPGSVQLSDVDGNVLQGSAGEVRINDFPIRGIRYRYLPSCIPLLKICYRIDYDQGQLQVAYDVLNGDTEISKTRIEYPVSSLLAYVPNALVRPVGRLQLRVAELSMLGENLVTARGELIWRDLGLDDDGIKIDVGDYQVDFTGNAQQYDFTVSDLDAALNVSGKGNITAAGLYEVDIKISAQGDIDPQVKSVLNLVAVRSSVNKYRIEQKGSLPADITRQLFRK
jgi:hypothetical protein